MNIESYEELMQRDLDGELSAEEKGTLSVYLAENPEAMALQKRLKTADGALSGDTPVEPPPSLRTRVMDSITAQSLAKATAPRRASSLFENVIERFRARPIMTFGFGMAAGIIALMPLAGRLADPALVPASQVSGTMVTDRAWPSGVVVDELKLDLDGVSGTARLSIVENRLVVSMDVSSSELLEVKFGYQMRQMLVAGFLIKSPDRVSLYPGDGLITATHVGHAEYEVAFDAPNRDISTLTVNITRGDRSLFSGELSNDSK